MLPRREPTLLFLRSADAKNATILTANALAVAAIDGWGERNQEMHAEMLATHNECHAMQDRMLEVTVTASKALENPGATSARSEAPLSLDWV